MALNKKQATQFTTAATALVASGWALFGLNYLINSTSRNATSTEGITSFMSLIAFVANLLGLIFSCIANKTTEKKVQNILDIVFSAIYMGIVVIGLVIVLSFLGRYY